MSILLQLFLSFFKIGLFSFGGGYAAISLIQQEIINTHQWIDLRTFSDIITISQMTPGPIGINAATFIGISLDNLPGGIIATLGFVTPSFIIVSILGYVYLKYGNLTIIKVILQGLRPVIVGVIGAAGLTLLVAAMFKNGVVTKDNLMPFQGLLFVIAVGVIIKKQDINPVLVMLLTGVLNLVVSLVANVM